MTDVVMIATMVGFVLLCVAYVQWCDRMIGHDPGGVADGGPETDRAHIATPVAAAAEREVVA